MTNKRMLAFALALLMCLMILPASALAADEATTIEVPGVPVANSSEVTVGNCKYVLDGTATLSKYTGSGGAVTIPSEVNGCKVTKIGDNAFFGSAITALDIPSTVQVIGDDAFTNCTSLATITIRGNIGNCSDSHAPFDNAGTASLKVTFASDVTKIPANIFMGSNVHSVTIPKTVTEIQHNAFDSCTGLTTLTFTQGNSLKKIGEEAFKGCNALTSISLPSTCTKLGDSAFEDCRGLTSITIAGNIAGGSTNVFKRAGYNSGSITLTFKSSVTSISDIFVISNASYAPKVTKIIFQGSAPAIDGNAFKNIKADVIYDTTDTSFTPIVGQGFGGELNWDGVAKVKITEDPKDILTTEGQKVQFKVKATGSDLEYQWQLSTDDGTTYTDIAGATKSYYTITSTTAAMSGNLYRCVVSNTLNSVKSKGAKLTVQVKPTITTHPSDVTVKEGKEVKFTVKATGGNLKYQWYIQEDGTTFWTKISGATKATYTFKADKKLNTYHFRCRVYNDAGSTYSNSAQLLVIAKPVIKTQPAKKATRTVGGSVSFKVKAIGVGLKYQWYYRTSSKKGWKAITGATTEKLTLLNLKKGWNGRQYRCRVWNSAGTVYTSVSTLKLK